MTRETSSYTPRRVTLGEARSRVQDVKDLVDAEDYHEAMLERNQLLLDVLYSIADAPTMADKRELKRLAAVALTAFDIPIVGRQQT